ncbi:MAG: DUF2610 domain-containing protein [Candidatus Midichloria sp.]|nr:DUF2610 domain-containing protein [Candidatus Midichloria sp.]
MKKFEVPCFFGGKKSMVPLYIGNPEPTHSPIHFQADWLSKERGGQVPSQIIESLIKIQKLAVDNGVEFEELCHYALEAANNELKQEGSAEPSSNAEDNTQALPQEDSPKVEPNAQASSLQEDQSQS